MSTSETSVGENIFKIKFYYNGSLEDSLFLSLDLRGQSSLQKKNSFSFCKMNYFKLRNSQQSLVNFLNCFSSILCRFISDPSKGQSSLFRNLK